VSEPILELRGVTLGFDGFVVLDGLDFALERGELRFVIGPNGAGKTTMLDVVTGKTRPASGRVLFDGRVDVLHHAEHELARLGVGRKFQTPSVYPSLTVGENLAVAAGARGGLLGLFGRLDRASSERVAAALETVGLAHRREARAGALSHGEKQWLEIAMLLVQEPRLLLLDEPVAGMTRAERDRTGELLERIVADGTSRRRSVLVVEHDMTFVRRYARTVTVLHQGRVLREGTMEQVQADRRVMEVYLGRSAERAA
jgi:urea transport system ATP-binding protein